MTSHSDVIINELGKKIEVVVDKELLREWQLIYKQYYPLLKPNRKSVSEVLEYIKLKYPFEYDLSDTAKEMVEYNIIKNDYYRSRLNAGSGLLDITVLKLKNQGEAAYLYKNRTEFSGRGSIFVGAESKSGTIFIEGSEMLSDEITMLQGLDFSELQNVYIVANYIQCLKRNGRLELVIE